MRKQKTTYYCDRCGKEMPVDYAISCPTSPKTLIQILHDTWEYADLCDRCKGSFKAWWELWENKTGEIT